MFGKKTVSPSAALNSAMNQLTAAQAMAQQAQYTQATLGSTINQSPSQPMTAHTIARPIQMIQSGDTIIRQARNGFTVLMFPMNATEPSIYVAKDLDEVGDVIKLAAVNQKLDDAK